jgi:hypothetical protein
MLCGVVVWLLTAFKLGLSYGAHLLTPFIDASHLSAAHEVIDASDFPEWLTWALVAVSLYATFLMLLPNIIGRRKAD